MNALSYWVGSGYPNITEILAHCLGQSHAWIYTHLDVKPTLKEQSAIIELIEAQASGVPLPYLLREIDFYGNVFHINPHCLIPRSQTELLVDLALPLLKEQRKMKVLDLGTGSGVIAVCLAKLRPNITIFASDISKESLQIAKFNSKTTTNNKIHFVVSSWLSSFATDVFDLIISNPPYVEAKSPYLASLRHEPINALIADDDGLSCFRIICKEAARCLRPGGTLILEHGYRQQEHVKQLLSNNAWEDVEGHTDYAGESRALLAHRPSQCD